MFLQTVLLDFQACSRNKFPSAREEMSKQRLCTLRSAVCVATVAFLVYEIFRFTIGPRLDTQLGTFAHKVSFWRADRPSLVVGLITRGSEEDHDNILLARQTWAKHVPAEQILILSHRSDSRINSVKSRCTDSYSLGVCCKTSELFSMMYARHPRADWFLRATDDSIWHIESLLQRLAGFRSTAKHLLGCVGIVKGTAFLERGNGEPHPAGGAGYIMSNALARWWSRNQHSYLRECWHDDLSIGHYVRQVLGIVTIHLHGVLQEPQIRENLPDFSEIVECKCPLPPPLYYNTGVDERLPQGYAVLYPFTPFIWEDALAWHMKAKYWESLLKLEAGLEAHRKRSPDFAGDTLLIFIETDSTFEGTYETLPSFARDPKKHPGIKQALLVPTKPSLCLLKPYMRMISFLACNVSKVPEVLINQLTPALLTESMKWPRGSSSSDHGIQGEHSFPLSRRSQK